VRLAGGGLAIWAGAGLPRAAAVIEGAARD